MARILLDPAWMQNGRRKSVLVLDDDAHIRALLRDLLEEHGYQVYDAVTGKRAVVLAGRSPVDLLIADVVLPDAEAVDTIRALRVRLPALKVIAMSGAVEGYDAEAIRTLGADETIRKPFDTGALLDIIDDLLKGSKAV